MTSKPLNIRQARFAEFVAGGMAATQAYIKAGYSQDLRIAESHACRLVENGGVKARIAEIRARDSAKEEFTREKLAQHLVAAITTPISQIDKDSPLVQEYTEEIVRGGGRGKSGETVIRRKIKMIGRLESVRLLCEIKGWKEPEQHMVETGPTTLNLIEERARNVISALDLVGQRRAAGQRER